MKRLLSIPLRVVLPVLLLSCAAIAGLLSWKLNTRLLGDEIESQFLDEAKLRITGLQATLEYHFRKGDSSGVNLQVSGMPTRSDVLAAYVLDRQDHILAATRRETIGNTANAIGANLPEDLKNQHAAQIAQVRASTHGSMVLSQDRRMALACYPLLVDVDAHALRSTRNGLLVLVFDMQIAKARALRAAERQAYCNALVFGGIAVCAWVFLHLSLTRRVAGLVATTRQLALGNFAARTGIAGSDELAQVGKAFDLMADRIAEDILCRKQAEERLERTHRELLGASRRAGMAEVATSVLHNVGNVLNSVNTSLSVATTKVSRIKTTGLSRIAALLDEHAENLPAFFAEHPQGMRLPAFLTQWSAHLAGEQQSVLQELELLRGNLEHVNEIVAMQQTYAGVGGVIEVLPLADVIEDALRMNAAAFDRHGTEVVREFDPALPPVPIDRNKLLLILVNLLRNAKYACDETGAAEKRITVQICSSEDGGARIVVHDNGVGIPPENLTRIFAHGFTTRKNGHGFGLHSSALAASEMGGSLHVHSAGRGHGATFTVELPLTHSRS